MSHYKNFFILWKVVTYQFPTNFNTIIKINKHTIAETRLSDLNGSSCFQFRSEEFRPA